MNETEALEYLTKNGNLAVPCSRYGRDSEECAPIAVAVARICAESNGDHLDEAALDFAMGLVVNDHDDVAYSIREYGTDADRVLLR